jgi:hypothetical protein
VPSDEKQAGTVSLFHKIFRNEISVRLLGWGLGGLPPPRRRAKKPRRTPAGFSVATGQ